MFYLMVFCSEILANPCYTEIRMEKGYVCKLRPCNEKATTASLHNFGFVSPLLYVQCTYRSLDVSVQIIYMYSHVQNFIIYRYCTCASLKVPMKWNFSPLFYSRKLKSMLHWSIIFEFKLWSGTQNNFSIPPKLAKNAIFVFWGLELVTS